ncbi:MAG: STAS-like domain-containing protein [Myxococcaceae bacterium]
MRIAVRKFGEVLTSRPAGRDAGQSIKAYFRPKDHEPVELDFDGVLAVGPSWLDEVLTLLRAEFGETRVICLPSDNVSVIESLKILRAQHGSTP